MTDRTADLEQRLLALRPPLSHDQMASRVRRFGIFYYTECWLRAAKAWAGTILGVGTLTPVIYLVALGIGLGVTVDAAGGQEVLGMSYLAFVAPALLISAEVSAAAEENTVVVMSGFKWKNTYYGPFVTPIQPEQIADGHVLGASTRYLATSTIYLSVLVLFGAVPLPSGLLLLPIAVLTANAVGLVLMAYSATVTEDRGQFALVARFVIAPMMLFSGTFFPLETLPAVIQPLGWLSPVWHGTQLGRDATTSYSEPLWLMVVHVAFLAALGAAGWWSARRTFRKRLIV